jgi:hypothetical protein
MNCIYKILICKDNGIRFENGCRFFSIKDIHQTRLNTFRVLEKPYLIGLYLLASTYPIV